MRKKLLALLLSAVMVITMTGTILAESWEVSSGVAPSEPALSEVVFDEDSGTIGSSSVALPESEAEMPIKPGVPDNPDLRVFPVKLLDDPAGRAINGGSGAMAMYNHRSNGYSFPSNYFLPQYAGDRSSYWCELALTGADGSTKNMQRVYCIEHRKKTNWEDIYDARDTWDGLSAEKQHLINLALSYGYNDPGNLEQFWSETDGHVPKYIATQVAIWLIIDGNFDGSNEADILSHFFMNTPAAYGYYNNLKAQIKSMSVIPSFANSLANVAPEYEMTYNPVSGRYEVSVPDSSNVCHDWSFSNPNISAEKITMNGVQGMRFSTTKSDLDSLLCSGERSVLAGTARVAVYWEHSGSQGLCSAKPGTPSTEKAYFKLKINNGALHLKKTSEDGKVNGFRFHIRSLDGFGEWDRTTDASGNLTLDNLKAGRYEVSEQNVPSMYEAPEKQVVTVVSGQTTEVSFYNALKIGRITLTKTISDDINFAHGNPTFLFKLEGMDLTGKSHTYYRAIVFDKEAVAGNTLNGMVSLRTVFEGIKAGTYTASEVEVSRYEFGRLFGLSGNAMQIEEMVEFDMTISDEGFATFQNEKLMHHEFNHNAIVVNHVGK